MNKMDLLKAMNGIDEQFLLEADPYEKAVRRSFSLKRNWKLVSAFAVLLLAVGIFYPFYKSAPFDGNFSNNSAPAPIAVYDTEFAEEMTGFDLLPETLAGGTLKENYAADEHTAIASYCDENGNETSRIIRQDIPFTTASDQTKDDAAERKETESAASYGQGEIETVYWEENGFYYCIEIRTSGEDDSGEMIAEAIRSIR